MTTPLNVSPEVEQALARNQPIVALESTIITHGMPWPQNFDVACAVEDEIRANGAVPATIAVEGGTLHIGMEQQQIKRLARAQNVMKLSRADLAYALAMKKTGATTVAATMVAAELAGIGVFATGGIGGVHRGAETSFDISADLGELSRTNVIVVSAGPKAILDAAKTMEVLESGGVPVIGYQSNVMPAFWSSTSPIAAPLRLDRPEEIAAMALMRQSLSIKGGVLIANPVPTKDEIPADTMAIHINQAIREAEAAGIVGKAVTPWLLSRIFELTDGKSLETNIALVMNNARLAAEIATALCKLL